MSEEQEFRAKFETRYYGMNYVIQFKIIKGISVFGALDLLTLSRCINNIPGDLRKAKR